MTKTVIFIHGAWMTPASWGGFPTVFESAGFTTSAPAWPYMERPVADLRESPADELHNLGITDIVDHYAAAIAQLPEPPVIVGHSFGGLVTQLLLDRGLGAAGVAIDPAPPRGVLPAAGAIKTSFAVFSKWKGWDVVHTMSESAFRSGFANGLTADQQTTAYVEQVVPAPGKIFFQAAIGKENGVDWKKPDRAPLLFVAGGIDKTVPSSMVHANYRKACKHNNRTELKDYPDRCHFQMAQDGWETVANDCLTWVTKVLSS